MLLKQLFSRRWILVTLLAVVAIVVMIRLGFWQLDRLEQRRAFNRQVLATRDLEPLDLSTASVAAIDNQLYRKAFAEGEYDFDHQVILTNQEYQTELGVHLLTPMKMAGSGTMVLVDRGWVPYQDYQDGNLAKYNVPGITSPEGMLIGTTTQVGIRSCLPDSSPALDPLVVFCVDLAAIQNQLPYQIAPLYLVRQPASTDEQPPVGTTVQIEISEGPHQSYAIQWFSFSILLAIGYPIYVYRDTKARKAKEAAENQAGKSLPPANSSDTHGSATV
jgi:surfeit locus 1 family protein